jgi:hypothetical protein
VPARKALLFIDKNRLFELDYIAERSGHSRGSTVDLTIISLSTGAEVDMGSPFDLFDTLSWPTDESVTAAARANRMLLQSVMREHGFRGLREEWWHFTLEGEPHPETSFEFVVRKRDETHLKLWRGDVISGLVSSLGRSCSAAPDVDERRACRTWKWGSSCFSASMISMRRWRGRELWSRSSMKSRI